MSSLSLLQFTPPVVKELLGWKRGEMSAQVRNYIFIDISFSMKVVSFGHEMKKMAKFSRL